jgi:hypothetical protein
LHKTTRSVFMSVCLSVCLPVCLSVPVSNRSGNLRYIGTTISQP